MSVSEFYFVSVPDILYGRLRDFYMILNCVGTQNLNYAPMQNVRTNRTMVIGVIIQTRVPLEIWKNKESFYI